MISHRLAALAALVAWVFATTAPLAHAQYTEGLPAGILAVEVDGQPIDAVTVPVTATATPEISGRVELASPIEIAVADGEVIRFAAQLDDRGRFRAAVPQALPDAQYTLYINDVLIGSFAVQGGAPVAEDRAPGPPLDIARVVPYPADFADLLPGLGFLDGRFYTLDEEASRTAGEDATAAAVRETQRGLAQAGWLQRYENRLAAPSADNPDTFSVQFSSFVVEYASGADARTAFVALVGEDPGVEFAQIGDESVLTMLSGVTLDTGAEYQAARLIYRVGPLLGMIVYADLLNQPPDLALLESVAVNVAGRGAVIADRQTIPLGSMTLRLDTSTARGRLTRRDLYEVRAGTLTALYGEDDATRESRVELFTGTTDSFSSTTSGTFSLGERDRGAQQEEQGEPAAPTPTSVIGIEGQSPAPEVAATPSPQEAPAEPATAQVFMLSALYEFPGDAEADAWFVAQRDRTIADAESGATSFSEVPDGPALGDVSATFSLRRPVGAGEETAGGYRLYSRVGPIVAVIEAVSIPDLTLEGTAALMSAQVACIQESGCSGLAALSEAMFATAAAAPVEATESITVITEPSGEPAEDPTTAPTQAPVIVVEGEATDTGQADEPRPTREPREDRERRRDRDETATEIPPG